MLGLSNETREISNLRSQVLASYAQQLAIAILGWIFLGIPRIYYATCARYKPHAKSGLKTKLERFEKRRDIVATVPALVDFHETQIFFSITLQVVCLVALTKAEKLEATTAGELVVNQFLIKAIGAAGIFPVVLNLCTLWRNKPILDWFILSASSCCVLIAAVTWSQAMSVSIDADQLVTGDLRPPFECGYENPMRYCVSPVALSQVYDWLMKRMSLSIFDRVFMSGPEIAVSLLALIALVATRIRLFRVSHTDDGKGNVFEWALPEATQPPSEYTRLSHLTQILYILATVCEAWLCLWTVILLAGIGFLMVPVVHLQPHWSIGNILAVAVRVPVFVKWLHLLYRKYCLLRKLIYFKAGADSTKVARKKAQSTGWRPDIL